MRSVAYQERMQAVYDYVRTTAQEVGAEGHIHAQRAAETLGMDPSATGQVLQAIMVTVGVRKQSRSTGYPAGQVAEAIARFERRLLPSLVDALEIKIQTTEETSW